MYKLGFVFSLIVLGGCTAGTNSGHLPAESSASLFDKPYGSSAPPKKTQVVYSDIGEKPLTNSDIKAINEAIAAGKPRYWAPQEEVLQQQMSEDF